MIGSENDKKLWRRFADAQGSAPTPPPPARETVGKGSRDEVAASAPVPPSDLQGEEEALLISAWLDGRLSDSEREEVEAWLAGRPDLLDLAVSSARSSDLSAPWPKRAQTRAAALVAPAARPGWRFMAAAAAAVLVVALGGFEMGQAGSQWLAGDAETDLAAELGLVPETNLMETLL